MTVTAALSPVALMRLLSLSLFGDTFRRMFGMATTGILTGTTTSFSGRPSSRCLAIRSEGGPPSTAELCATTPVRAFVQRRRALPERCPRASLVREEGLSSRSRVT